MQLDLWFAGGQVMQYYSTSPELGLQVEDHPGSTTFGHTRQSIDEQLLISLILVIRMLYIIGLLHGVVSVVADRHKPDKIANIRNNRASVTALWIQH